MIRPYSYRILGSSTVATILTIVIIILLKTTFFMYTTYSQSKFPQGLLLNVEDCYNYIGRFNIALFIQNLFTMEISSSLSFCIVTVYSFLVRGSLLISCLLFSFSEGRDILVIPFSMTSSVPEIDISSSCS